MQDILNKILSNEKVAEKSEDLNKRGKKVVLVNGVFDLLHSGHISFLRNAKSNGDILIVATNSDASVKKYKGNGRPILSEKYRAIALASLFFVDYVTIFNEDKALKIIETIKPNILVKGIYYDAGRVDEEAKLMDKLGGKVVKINHSIKLTTSQIIDKIKGVKID